MTVDEVASYLRVHAMTVYRLIGRGDLPAMRVGRGWRFRRDQIDRWLIDNLINGSRMRTKAHPSSSDGKGRRRSRG
jgi:excisionase family DNA binding protein